MHLGNGVYPVVIALGVLAYLLGIGLEKAFGAVLAKLDEILQELKELNKRQRS